MLTPEYAEDHLPERNTNLLNSLVGSKIKKARRLSNSPFSKEKAYDHFAGSDALLNLQFDNGLSVNFTGMDFLRSFFIQLSNHTEIGYDTAGIVYLDKVNDYDATRSPKWSYIINQTIKEVILLEKRKKIAGIKIEFEENIPAMLLSHHLSITTGPLAVITEQEIDLELKEQLAYISTTKLIKGDQPELFKNIIPIITKEEKGASQVCYDLSRRGLVVYGAEKLVNSKTAFCAKQLKSFLDQKSISIIDPQLFVLVDGSLVLKAPIDLCNTTSNPQTCVLSKLAAK